MPLRYANDKAWGLTPRNRGQKMAFELLMDEEIQLVTLSGGAGTGKSILSVAVALQKVIESNLSEKMDLDQKSFSYGNIKPDLSPQCLRKPHMLENYLFLVYHDSNRLISQSTPIKEFSIE